MGMAASSGVRPVMLVLIAALVFLVGLALARTFRWVFHRFSRRLGRYVPPRISHLAGLAAAVLLFWALINGVLFNALLDMADRSFQQLDALIDDELPHPTHPEQTGSTASLINWEDLGRQGRSSIASGPIPAPASIYTA